VVIRCRIFVGTSASKEEGVVPVDPVKKLQVPPGWGCARAGQAPERKVCAGGYI